MLHLQAIPLMIMRNNSGPFTKRKNSLLLIYINRPQISHLRNLRLVIPAKAGIVASNTNNISLKRRLEKNLAN